MLLSWIAFSARSPTFQYSSVPELCEKWSQFEDAENNGLKRGSIIYWAKQDANPHDFINVRNANIDEYVNATLKNITLLGVSRSEKNIGCGDAD